MNVYYYGKVIQTQIQGKDSLVSRCARYAFGGSATILVRLWTCQLCQYIQSTSGTAFSCNYTPHSLIDLWEWFEPQISVVEKSAEEYEEELKQFPNWMHDSISRETLSIKTLALITDISFYFAKTFIAQNPTVYWGYFTKPKNEVSINMPVLMGFRSNIKLDPRRIVHVCASKSCETRDKNRLFDIYQTWLGYIAQERCVAK